MGKTPPKEEEADGNPRKKAPRVDDAALTTDAEASAPSPTGSTPPKGEGAEKSPRKTASRLDDADLSMATGASASSPTRKTPLKDEAEGSPPRKSLRRQDKQPAAAVPLPTVPESSELIVKGAGRASDEKRCKCNHVITYGTIMNWAPLLESKDAWTCCGCQRENKEGNVKTRPPKSDLLICVTCYDHLCCGVGSIAYPFGHSREHALEKEHLFAVLYCDPERGYCFQCNAEVPMPVKFGDRDNEVGLQVIRSIVRRKLLDPPPSLGALITASAPSPTGKTPLKGEAEGSLPKRSQSLQRQDKGPAAAVCLATVPESSELIVEWLGRASDEKQCKCNHIITDEVIDESRDMKQMGLFQGALTCFGCSNGPEKSDILICGTCCDHCSGFGSIDGLYGHSLAHAQEKEHCFDVLYSDPTTGYCFKCDTEVRVPVKFGEGGNKVGLQEIRNNAQGYAIRGLPNLGNTCYMSAVLQCLFVLGKLRERILALDRPESPLAKVLKKLFVEASAAGDELNLEKLLKRVHKHRSSNFKVGTMEDSHDFLTALRELWNQGDAPTVMDSIFGFEMARTLSCKKCGHSSSPVPNHFQDLSMGFPPKGYPTKSAALPQTNESPRSRNLEKMQTVSATGYSDVIGSDVIVEKTHKPLEVDSTEAQRISQKKDVVQSPLQIQEGLTSDSVSIEDFLWFFSKDQLAWRCPNCASQSKNGEQTVGSGKEDTTVFRDQIEQSDMTACHSKETECHGGILPAEKQTDLLETNQSADASEQLMMHLETVKQSEQAPTAYLLKDSKNEQKDYVGDNISFYRFTMLPPVLTLHLKRTDHETGSKISDHVTFMEYLDVKEFMDPSSIDEGNTRYHLVGVVQHIGKELNSGHYIAYVRARRLGNQQEGNSCSSSWFYANDQNITQVSIEEVLKIEVYILFYERVEKDPEDILSWEIIQSDEIVNCTVDSEEYCSMYKKKSGKSQQCGQLLHNACIVIEKKQGAS